jgi:hypothetical protein
MPFLWDLDRTHPSMKNGASTFHASDASKRII